jgi:hypothetical protein
VVALQILYTLSPDKKTQHRRLKSGNDFVLSIDEKQHQKPQDSVLFTLQK